MHSIVAIAIYLFFLNPLTARVKLRVVQNVYIHEANKEPGTHGYERVRNLRRNMYHLMINAFLCLSVILRVRQFLKTERSQPGSRA